MTTLLLSVFSISLLGSLHCAGMCGPLVPLAVGTHGRRHLPAWTLHLAYHGGRFITYGLLGAIAGALGAAIDFGGDLTGLRDTAARLAGATIFVVALIALLRYLQPHGLLRTRSNFSRPAGPQLIVPLTTDGRPLAGRSPGVLRWLSARTLALLRSSLAGAHRVAAGFPPLPRAAIIGLLTTCLPCGWLYAFALTAAGTGQPLAGAAVMLTFWAGTVPALLSVGVALGGLQRAVGPRAGIATAVALLALGAYTVTGRLSVPASAFSVKPPGRTSPAIPYAGLERLTSAEMPCCHGGGQ